MKKIESYTVKVFKDYCIYRHDIYCNQKYGESFIPEGLPYSFHLRAVAEQVYTFKHLITEKELDLVLMGAWGHDLIEDARVTYNDILQKVGQEVADIIYACTELRGHNRDERHGDEYFETLVKNDLAVFVKLCDIIANVKFSLLTNSSMYNAYQKEFPKINKKLFKSKFSSMFDYLEILLNLKN